MVNLVLDTISKRFGDGAPAVDQLSLNVADGEFVALLGPSGCGKTTALRLIAGLEQLSAGEIRFDDQTVSSTRYHLPPERRRVGIVFQSYALWPHMTVARNIGYPLEVAGIRGRRYRERIHRALRTVELEDFAERRPAELSGGQRQRVALARCLVMDAAVVLFDEPLANLDVHLRASLEEAFSLFQRQTGATVVYITHDQAEAMALAQRVAVMEHGRLAQFATPDTLYRQPATRMVAEFIGRGAVVPSTVLTAAAQINGDSRCEVALLGQRFNLRCQPDQRPGPALVSLRPEQLRLIDQGIGIPGQVQRRVYRGGFSAVSVTPDHTPAPPLLLALAQPPAVGTAVRVAINDGWVIPLEPPP